MIPDDLSKDMPSFLARFGTDQQCREYLFKARWPEGFRCLTCGHGDAYALKTKIVYECVACGKQHSLLAGTRANRRLVGTSVAGMAEVAFGVLGGDGGQRRAEGGMKAVHRPRRSLAQ